MMHNPKGKDALISAACNVNLKRSVDGESADRKCVWDLDLVDSVVKQLAEAFNLPTPLSQQDNEDWRERIKDWRGNAFY